MQLLQRLAAVVTSLPGRLLVTGALLALVARSIDWDVLAESLSGATWGWFALATVLVCVALLVGAIRWHALLHAAELPVSPRETLRAYGIGIFSNNFLPTGFGGDAVRAWIVARSGKPLARAVTSVFVDRAAALACLLALGWLGLAFSPIELPAQLATPFIAATVGGVVAVLAGVMLLRRRGLSRLLPSLVRPWASEIARVLRKYGRNHHLQARVLVLSVTYQVLMITSLWMLSRALQLDLAAAVLAVVMPLVLIATLAPVSIAGFGVREGTYVLLLGELGVSAGDATLLSLFTVASLAIASLPGGIAIALRRRDREMAHLPPLHVEPRPTADQAAGQ